MTFQLLIPFLKVFGVFAVVLFLLQKRLPLGPVFMAGGLGLGMIFSLSFRQIATIWGRTLIDPQTLLLAAIVSLIQVFSHQLEVTGRLHHIVETFRRGLGSTRVSLAALPALVGLLPMPGGAVFSAPMVDAAAARENLSPDQKTFVNYWFRHIWEFWWPLYPSVILAGTITGFSIHAIIAWQIWFTPLLLLSGWFVIYRKMSLKNPEHDEGHSIKEIPEAMMPIIFLLGLTWLLSWVGSSVVPDFWPQYENYSTEIPLVISLAVSIVLITKKYRKKMTKNGFGWNKILQMVFMIAGIMVFKAFLVQSGAVDEVSLGLAEIGVPIIIVVIFLPFASGFVSGIAVGYVGAAYPLLSSLIQNAGATPAGSYYALAFASGFVGVLMSPVHLCLILTKDYFKAQMINVLRLVFKPVLVFMGIVIILHYLEVWLM